MLRKLHGRKLAVCLLGGAMYALFAAFGWQAEHDGHIHLGYALLTAALLVWPIAALLSVLLERGYTRSMRQEKRFRTGWAFLFILACYVPMFGVAFPGSFAYDVPYQLRQVVTGAYSTHHPLLHTLLLGGLLQLGRALGNMDIGAAIYTAVQMGLLAGCFALTCSSIAQQSRRAGGKTRGGLFCALSAAHGDGGERDEGCAVRRFFRADACVFERDEYKTDPQSVRENSGMRRFGSDAAQQHGLCRAGVAGTLDNRFQKERAKRGAGRAAGAGAGIGRKRGTQTRDACRGRRFERNALLADSAVGARAAL